MRCIFVIAVTLLITGCQSAAPDQAAIAVILHSPPHPRLASCLSISGKDPSQEVLSALRKAGRRVDAKSTCSEVGWGVVTPAKDRAAFVSIDGFTRVVPWRATAELSTHSGPLSGSTWRVKLKRSGGAWVVVSTELVSMS